MVEAVEKNPKVSYVWEEGEVLVLRGKSEYAILKKKGRIRLSGGENMKISGIAHTAFNVADIHRSLEFYCGGLGLKKLFELKLGDGRTICYLKLSERDFIELFYGGSAKGGANAGSYEHFCLEVEDIRQVEAELKEKGIAFDGPPSQGLDGNFQLWTADPDGNRIEFMQYGAHPLQFPEKAGQ